MSEPLDDSYFRWLYRQVASLTVKSAQKTYWRLLKQLFTKEFIWLVPNDDNRVEDGRDLRNHFLEEMGIEETDPNWMELGCSFLEMLIGLSRRLSFEAEGEPRDWFWILMRNLEMHELSDAVHIPINVIESKMDTVIWRTYEPNGVGGLFPLKYAIKDQREVELWYQLNGYLIEGNK